MLVQRVAAITKLYCMTGSRPHSTSLDTVKKGFAKGLPGIVKVGVFGLFHN